MNTALDDSATQATGARAAGLVALAYVPALLSMMTVGILVPFIGRLGEELAATPAQMGFAIALYSMPTAILALMGGSLVDRFGVRHVIIVSLLIATAASGFASLSRSLAALDAAVLLAGLGYGGICVASPCLLLNRLAGAQRTRGMSFLSSYPPTGYAVGLLLGAAFVTSGNWSLAFQIHAALLLLWLLVSFLTLPPDAAPISGAPAAESPLAGIAASLRERAVIGLGIAVALPNAVSYGTSLAAPAHLARLYNVSLALSATAVATAKIIALVIGSLAMGYLLSRSRRTFVLFAVMVAVGIVAQALIFLPIGGIFVATCALILWIFAFGGMAGGAMALLPVVVKDKVRGGAASGLVNQFISAASFAAPSTWLALRDGTSFVALAAACLVISLLALPKR
jgi:predicted MFS family arabinose efflux permease